jgi:hypothetical protein
MTVTRALLDFVPIVAVGIVTVVVTIALWLKNANSTEAQLFQRYRKLLILLIVMDVAASGTTFILLLSHMQHNR